MTAKEVKTYLEETYGECKHDEFAMADAVNQTQQDMDYDNEWDLFHLLVENTPIPSLHTHSYGFHTATGRHIITSLQAHYYDVKDVTPIQE